MLFWVKLAKIDACRAILIFMASLPPPCSELDQSNVTEENPEGEEHPAADSENK